MAFSKPQNKSVAELGFEFGFIWAPTGSLRTLHLLCAHEVTVVMTSCLLILGRDQMKLVPGLTGRGLPWAERGPRGQRDSKGKRWERAEHLHFTRFRRSARTSSKASLSTGHSCNNTKAGPPLGCVQSWCPWPVRFSPIGLRSQWCVYSPSCHHCSEHTTVPGIFGNGLSLVL